MRYLDELLRLKSGPDLLAWGVFPNAKEVTESFGAYTAALKYLHLRSHFRFEDPEVTCLVVGDGRTPRTAATFAVRTKWACFSIDPMANPDHVAFKKVVGLTCVPKKIEDCTPLDFGGPKMLRKTVFVCVHTHARMELIRVPLPSMVGPAVHQVGMILMPCCVPLVPWSSESVIADYWDWSIHSPCRHITVTFENYGKEV